VVRVYDAFPYRIPLLSADPCLVSDAFLCGDSLDTLGMLLHAGRVDLSFLSAASVGPVREHQYHLFWGLQEAEIPPGRQRGSR